MGFNQKNGRIFPKFCGSLGVYKLYQEKLPFEKGLMSLNVMPHPPTFQHLTLRMGVQNLVSSVLWKLLKKAQVSR